MPLKYQLTAEEYAQLDEVKQAFYALQGDVYICQIDGLPQPEDVSGLKRKNEELLAEKRASDERCRAAKEEARRKEEERLAAEGNFQQLYESFQTKTAEWEQRYSQLEQSIHQRDINLGATRIATAIADGDSAGVEGGVGNGVLTAELTCRNLGFGLAENTDDLFIGKTLLHGDVLMWLMKTLLTSRCVNQRGAG